MGTNSAVRYPYNISIGYNSFTSGAIAIAIGNGATSNYNQSIALGYNVVTTANNQLAIGTAAQPTRISFVSPGTLVTDAVNLGQLAGYAKTDYNVAPSTIAVGASPFTYQNTTGYDADILTDIGTVTSIAFSRDNVTYYTTGLITGIVRLSPNDFIKVTYTVAPNMTLIPR